MLYKSAAVRFCGWRRGIEFRVSYRLLRGRVGNRRLQEVDERGFARVAGTNDEDTVGMSVYFSYWHICDLLVRCRVLSPSDSSRAVQRANGAVGITVSSAMRHALGASMRIKIGGT